MGFFISPEGHLLTNLHVVKPWLFDGRMALIEETCKRWFHEWAYRHDLNVAMQRGTMLDAYTSQLKVKGVLDAILLVPQGKVFSIENAERCRVLTAGEDTNIDVALIQTEKGELPSRARYINVKDSMDISDAAYNVGERVYVIGFPRGIMFQNSSDEKGIQVYAQPGNVTQQPSQYEFSYNAQTAGGSSGAPVFNRFGKLIGVNHAGYASTQGYNFGIKSKYVQELLAAPRKN